MSESYIEKFTVNLASERGLLVTSSVRGHEVLVDEPTDAGGTDKGPTPPELVLAALGACQIITLRFYARKLGIKLKSVKGTVEGTLDLRGFVGKAGVRAGFQEVKCSVILKVEGDRSKISQLKELAGEYCPILDTLKSAVKVDCRVE